MPSTIAATCTRNHMRRTRPVTPAVLG
jgi:hypothetical protein